MNNLNSKVAWLFRIEYLILFLSLYFNQHFENIGLFLSIWYGATVMLNIIAIVLLFKFKPKNYQLLIAIGLFISLVPFLLYKMLEGIKMC